MNLNANTIVVAKPLADVKGMLTVKSAKTGAQRIQLASKRDFTKAWLTIPANKEKPKKQAARDFEVYRQATLDAFNLNLATQIASGNIRAERLTADKTGDLRTISLVRRDRRVQDANLAALRKTSEITGIPLDELIKNAKKNAPEQIGVTEVAATEVKEDAATSAATTTPVEDKSEPNQPAPSVGEAVAAAQ